MSYRVWKKIGIFSHGAMSDVEYSINIFNNYVKDLGICKDLQGRLLVGIDPGDSQSSAVLCYQNDAKSIFIDDGDFTSNDLKFYNALFSQSIIGKDRSPKI